MTSNGKIWINVLGTTEMLLKVLSYVNHSDDPKQAILIMYVCKDLNYFIRCNQDFWMNLVRLNCCCYTKFNRLVRISSKFCGEVNWDRLLPRMIAEKHLKRQTGLTFASRVMISDFADLPTMKQQDPDDVNDMLDSFICQESLNIIHNQQRQYNQLFDKKRCNCHDNTEETSQYILRTQPWVKLEPNFDLLSDTNSGPIKERICIMLDLQKVLGGNSKFHYTETNEMDIKCLNDPQFSWYTVRLLPMHWKVRMSNMEPLFYREVLVCVSFSKNPMYKTKIAHVAAVSITRSYNIVLWKDIFDQEFLQQDSNRVLRWWWPIRKLFPVAY